MKDAVEFRRQAQECRQLAANEADDENKAYWLRKPDDWGRLAELAEKQQGQQSSN